MNIQNKPNQALPWLRRSLVSLACGGSLFTAPFLAAQDDEIIELSPFTIDASQDVGYRATSTLAGTRLRTNLKDVGSAITVITKEFLEDIGAVDNETLLSYTTASEVGGNYGNFAGVGNGIGINERGTFNNPNSNTRIRGLASADNTRNFFLSEIPWDGYVVDRIDMQRGPNAILFGLGSPAGIINATTQQATFRDSNNVEFRLGSFGSYRGSVNLNRVLIEDELSVRIAALHDAEQFRQEPSFDQDERIYAAFKYEPKFFQTESSRLTLNGNFENGTVRSNRPRNLTPQDNITPFFQASRDSNGDFPIRGGIDGRTFDPYLKEQRSLGIGHGQTRTTVEIPDPDNEGEILEISNPDYLPALGNYAHSFGGPMWFFDSPDATEASMVMIPEINPRGGLAPNGDVDDNIGMWFGRMSSINDYDVYATNAKLIYADFGQYKKQHLTDPTIYDYYNLLLDGPNKHEWAGWDAINLSLGHTFLDNRLGYEISYFDQDYDHGRVGITGWNDEIYIDTNSHRMDGSVNPNVGRPFISDKMIGGNNTYDSQRDAMRFTGFYEHDFQDNREGWLTRLMGNHTFTGVYAEDNQTVDSRNFHRFRMEDAFFDYTTRGRGPGEIKYDENQNNIDTAHYLGGSLLGKSSASGANLSNLKAIQFPSTASIYSFDTTWNATGVDPSALWTNPRTGGESTQSENEENYVGWTNQTFGVIDSMEGNNRDNAINQGSLARSEIESESLIWQGYFWDQAIVGTYGWRKDKVKNWGARAPELETGLMDISPSAYNLDFDPVLEQGQSHSYSVAVHFDRLLGSPDWMPFNLSGYYNESENFQPGAGRNDMFGQALAAPSGSTRDVSLLLASKDDKYSMKITQYKTSVTNGSSSYVDGTWFVGRFVAWGENWANIYEHNISNGFTLSGVAQEGDTRNWRYDMQDPNGVYDPEFEAKAIADWDAMVSEIKTKFPTYVDAWNMQGMGTEVKNFGSQDPAGLTYTEDAISEGTEYEFVAQPTENLRLAVNATRSKASRSKVGGEAMIRWAAFVDDKLNNTNAGDIRLWWAGGGTILQEWNKVFRSKYALTELLEGTASPELREWHFNAIGNYSFTEGGLKGFSVGSGLRWGDDVVLGYALQEDADGNTAYDLGSPYIGPTDTKVDFWVSYKRKLENDINWKIQFNLRDAFADKKLIPISTQPNGSYAAVRIPGSTTWTLSNTFEF